MKVLFVNPSAERCVDTFMTPLGILSIASYVEQFGHTAKVYDREVRRGSFTKFLQADKPDIVGVSVISGKAVKDAMKVTAAAKALGIPVVWGGLMPSCYPEFVLRESGADMVSVGEGELSWRELLDAMRENRPLDTVRGIVFQMNGDIVRTPPCPLADLSDLPPMNWELVDVKRYFKSYYCCEKMLYSYSSKGCPGQCTFCYNEFFNKSTHRRRPLETVLTEIRHLMQIYGMDGVYFADDLLFRNKDDMREFCAGILASGLRFSWGGYTRVIGSFELEDYQYMYDAGCRWLYFGIESGNREMQRKIKKNINFDKIEPAFDACTQVGIEANALFIVGFPDETQQEVMDTVKLAKSINTSQIMFAHFTPIASSEVYHQLVEDGKIKVPTGLKEIASEKLLDTISVNFSKVPDVELRVIRSYFLWKRFVVKKTATDKKPFAFTGKIVRDAFKGLSYANLEMFSIALALMRMTADLIFYPGIRKKYGLK